ncbi:MAG: kinase [Candidatus Staskawiczbacteria bacterium]|nr:kinase [Candidatus Staskawiczbacteria bacterium]
MVISKTPFRISFFGGGTDYPVWYEKYGGSVLSTTIDKYCYISTRRLPPFFDYKYRIRYTTREEVNDISQIQHPSVRESLNYLSVNNPIEMVHTSDLPARTGIGSSSAFTVGFLNSLYALQGKMIPKKQLALDAIHVEQNLIKENVGSQDHTASAFGGLNRIDFGGAEKISVKPIIMNPSRLESLQDHMMLFFTGFSRSASEIAGEQIKKTPDKYNELMQMKSMVDKAIEVLVDDNIQIEEFGKLLDQSWKLKRGLTHLISNNQIDEIYERGIKAGAIGGKLCGAGAGGFILFFVKPENQEKVKQALKDLLHVPFRFESQGSQIIFNNPQAL